MLKEKEEFSSGLTTRTKIVTNGMLMKVSELSCRMWYRIPDCENILDNFHRFCYGCEVQLNNEIACSLASVFLQMCKPRLEIPNTQSFFIELIDIESAPDAYSELRKADGFAKPKVYPHDGKFTYLIKKSDYDNLPNSTEKKKFFVGKIYNALLAFSEEFDCKLPGIDIAHATLITSDFFFDYYNPLKHNRTGLYAGVQKSPELDSDFDKYRLILWDYEKNIKTYFPLPSQKKSTVSMNELGFGENREKARLAKIWPPHSYDLIGWKRDKFLFSWGVDAKYQPYELYEFSLKTNEVNRIN